MIHTNKFTPLHLTILIAAYVGNPDGYCESPTATDYENDLIRQGLIYRMEFDNPGIHATKYGERKLQELLIKMELPGLNI